jgi:hypothetical protein
VTLSAAERLKYVRAIACPTREAATDAMLTGEARGCGADGEDPDAGGARRGANVHEPRHLRGAGVQRWARRQRQRLEERGVAVGARDAAGPCTDANAHHALSHAVSPSLPLCLAHRLSLCVSLCVCLQRRAGIDASTAASIEQIASLRVRNAESKAEAKAIAKAGAAAGAAMVEAEAAKEEAAVAKLEVQPNGDWFRSHAP